MDGFEPECVRVNLELDSDNDKFDELLSDHDSDGPRYTEFNAKTDMVNPKFFKGLIFSDRKVLKDAIKHYGRVNRVQVKLQKIDAKRIQAVCQGCRMIICVDGCYLKGYFQGHLLAAIGINANDQIYPITYAAVESENYSSWAWFLDIVKTDLGINDSCNICFMNDKQKELVNAVDDIFPNANVRNCVRHIYKNFKEVHKGKAFKDAILKAARVNYLREFEDAMEQMKAFSGSTYDWMQKLNPAQWSISHFDTMTKCDMLLNNLCESLFN
ncbi:hypothetical protein V6N13_036862 [Hibiscus sabdariffa]